jgi:hypothetical protein
VARKKSRLPLREGTKLPPLTEEERLKRRTEGHPLDDFPEARRMSKWREVIDQQGSVMIASERSAERSDANETATNTQHATPEPSDNTSLNQASSANMEITTKGSIERSTERSIAPPPVSSEISQVKEAYVALDATHTASEAKVYGYLYRLSIVRGYPTCRASLSHMEDALGLAKNTIIKAIRGLTEKLSIDVLQRRPGSRIGSQYHVYPVKEILCRRKDAGMEIDELKRIAPKGSIERSVERSIERAKIEPLNVQNLNVQLNVQTPSKPLSESVLVDARRTTKNLYIRNDDDVGTSSSSCDDDEKFVSALRDIYCDLTGNAWRDQDEQDTASISEIAMGHIILGICFSLDRAAGHRVGSLRYCIPSILDHHEAMRSFPEKALMEIAYVHMLRVKQAKRRDLWLPCSGVDESQ